MTNTEHYKQQATEAAKRDFLQGLTPDANRYGALKSSAWATHYNKEFKKAFDDSGEVYPRHYTPQQVQDLERALKVKQGIETVYSYLAETMTTARNQDKHTNATRKAEQTINILNGLIEELKNK